jgi:hypothetical protein
MRYVIVNGTPIIRDGQLVRDANPVSLSVVSFERNPIFVDRQQR